MGRPESRASVTMPSPARRAGPGGTSAVIANVLPSRRTLSVVAAGQENPAAIALVVSGARTADDPHIEFWQHLADDFGVLVPGDEAETEFPLIQRRHHDELSVPHRENERVIDFGRCAHARRI